MVYCRVGNFGLLSILDDLLRVKHVLSEEEGIPDVILTVYWRRYVP